MVEKLLGVDNDYVIQASCGKQFDEELKKLKKALKKHGRKVERVITCHAIIITKKVDPESNSTPLDVLETLYELLKED